MDVTKLLWKEEDHRLLVRMQSMLNTLTGRTNTGIVEYTDDGRPVFRIEVVK